MAEQRRANRLFPADFMVSPSSCKDIIWSFRIFTILAADRLGGGLECRSGRKGTRGSRIEKGPIALLSNHKAATYTRTRAAVAFIISELPGERAEALFIAMAAWVPTAGEQSAN
jgi:hypothetical protein